MAYLVYCPTCGGKMSANADVCPHCGERDFFREVPGEYVMKSRCMNCNGDGVVWLHTLYGGNEYNPKFPAGKDDFVCKFPQLGGRAAIFHNVGSGELRRRLEKCVSYGDYHLETYRGIYDLSFEEAICPKCRGWGKVDEICHGLRRIDIRKPV